MYAKVFTQIFDSSIADDYHLRHFFMDLLVLADINGVVDMTPAAIAGRTRIPIDQVQAHLANLESPDPESRTRDHDGRRIVRLDEHRTWGWCILNYDKFRAIASEDQRKALTRERVRKHREKRNASVTPSNACNATQTQTQRQMLAGESAGTPSIQEVLATASMIGLTEWKARDWFDEMEGCGWLDFQHRPVVRWQSILNRVKVKWEADGRPDSPPSNGKSSGSKNLSVLDMKTIVASKEERCTELKARHAAEGPLTTEWSCEPARLEFRKLRQEIKNLKYTISTRA